MKKSIQSIFVLFALFFITACSQEAEKSESSSTTVAPETTTEEVQEEPDSKVKLNLNTDEDGKLEGEVDVEIKK